MQFELPVAALVIERMKERKLLKSLAFFSLAKA